MIPLLIHKIKTKYQGVSLIEVLLAVTVGVLVISSAVILMGVALRSNILNRQMAAASGLLIEAHEAINNIVSSGWNNIYNLNKGEPNHYKLTRAIDIWKAESGEETITINNVVYTRYFVVENVSRTNGVIDSVYNASQEDPSTQKVTVYVKWGDPNNPHILSLPKYLSRSQNMRSFIQSDWSGGSGETRVLLQPNNRYDSGTNIQSTTN